MLVQMLAHIIAVGLHAAGLAHLYQQLRARNFLEQVCAHVDDSHLGMHVICV